MAEITKEFSDILVNDLGEAQGGIRGSKMKIVLKPEEEITPIQVYTARQVPLHYHKAYKKLMKELLSAGVISVEDEPTKWTSRAHFVPKPGTTESGDIKLRLVTDYRELNRAVLRPTHPFPSAPDLMRRINPTSRFFAKLDAVHGYFQIALDEPSSKLTTFILPCGRYRYNVAPMGLKSSSDEFCFRTDQALGDLLNDWLLKIVDDMLIQAPTKELLFDRLNVVLERCRAAGIKLSKKKLAMGQSIKFAGFVVSATGVKPDPDKVAAIAKFPAPRNITEVRSFLGLVNQLGAFIPDLSAMTPTIRSLLKKNNAFVWLPQHQAEFEVAKQHLCSPMVVQPFDVNLQTELLTDASRLHGLGFALLQREPNGKHRMIHCGSCSLTPCQTRYATIELECLAIVWAIEKCSYYLKGCPNFKVITDHKPLVGTFSKPLLDLDNARIHRFREKVIEYHFDVVWTCSAMTWRSSRRRGAGGRRVDSTLAE